MYPKDDLRVDKLKNKKYSNPDNSNESAQIVSMLKLCMKFMIYDKKCPLGRLMYG